MRQRNLKRSIRLILIAVQVWQEYLHRSFYAVFVLLQLCAGKYCFCRNELIQAFSFSARTDDRHCSTLQFSTGFNCLCGSMTFQQQPLPFSSYPPLPIVQCDVEYCAQLLVFSKAEYQLHVFLLAWVAIRSSLRLVTCFT